MRTKIFDMRFGDVYPAYVAKAERKGRSRDEVDAVIGWLTGYDGPGLRQQVAGGASFREFFDAAPALNPDAAKITGVVCGVRVETIEDPLTQKIRWLDKLVDELAKGRPLDKVLRS
jgi:hypothetical protein